MYNKVEENASLWRSSPDVLFQARLWTALVCLGSTWKKFPLMTPLVCAQAVVIWHLLSHSLQWSSSTALPSPSSHPARILQAEPAGAPGSAAPSRAAQHSLLCGNSIFVTSPVKSPWFSEKSIDVGRFSLKTGAANHGGWSRGTIPDQFPATHSWIHRNVSDRCRTHLSRSFIKQCPCPTYSYSFSFEIYSLGF